MPQKSRKRRTRSRKKQQSTFSLRRATSAEINKQKRSRPSLNMSLTELQNMAISRGIPFGGLSKNQLVEKIQKYN